MLTATYPRSATLRQKASQGALFPFAQPPPWMQTTAGASPSIVFGRVRSSLRCSPSGLLNSTSRWKSTLSSAEIVRPTKRKTLMSRQAANQFSGHDYTPRCDECKSNDCRAGLDFCGGRFDGCRSPWHVGGELRSAPRAIVKHRPIAMRKRFRQTENVHRQIAVVHQANRKKQHGPNIVHSRDSQGHERAGGRNFGPLGG